MHTTQRWHGTPWAGRSLSRGARAALCVAVVLLVHGGLWLAWSYGAAPIGARAVAVQVRQVALPAPLPLLGDAQHADAPAPMAGASATQPRRQVARARVPASAGETPLPTGSLAKAGTADTPITPPAASSAAPVAIYPTRIPPSTQLRFTLQRGTGMGEASLHWQVDAERYVLLLQASLPQGRALEQRSQGGFDEAGLAPLRLADRRGGRDVRAANFQREHGKVSFSGPRWEWPLPSGAQDRLTWLVQLVAIAGAAPDAMHEGAEVSMWVVGARGAMSLWRFEVRARQPLAAPGGDALAWWLVREPAHPYDLRIEVWLDPARGHWPVRLRQTQVPGGEALEWVLRDEPNPAPGS